MYNRKSNRSSSSVNSNASSTDDPERDGYGFSKVSPYIPIHKVQEFEARYQPMMMNRLYQWDRLLLDNGGIWPERSTRLRRFFRKGVPRHYRAEAWLHYSGAKALMDKNPQLYRSLVQSAEIMGGHNEYRNIIEQDLHRTFPDNEHFRCTDPETHRYACYSVACMPKIHALRRVLLALSIYTPSIGYCQSLNFIAALMLLCTENEEHTFWLMVATTSNILPPSTYDATMEDATVDQLTLLWLIFDRYPAIWSRISNDVPFWELEQKERPPPSALVTTHWFLTLFSNVLPIESVFRVWDAFFYEGHTVLFRMALALLEINSSALLNAEDSMEVFQIMQSLPKQAIDCNHLLDMAFARRKTPSDITDEEIQHRVYVIRERRKRREGNR
ncbi:hypothetical protein INT44_004566 [Umbelopsis vinacea]|uniref:Rab-GAP TBC domain-containing protein n=1 Tax=Umbelopsis vinacea TaxID=44442 RepID=A0A8H7QCI1_9FUNG|nr:hypothetical protein INT44_004566 [Umbelopsis vinacea]